MVGAAIHEAYAPTMPGRTLGYMVNLIAEDSGHNCLKEKAGSFVSSKSTRGTDRFRLRAGGKGDFGARLIPVRASRGCPKLPKNVHKYL